MRGTTRRPASLGAAAATYIDLGSEPALAVGSRSVGLPAKRAVSIRWLSGTVLTGFTSFCLMGGALIAALNGQNILATPQSADIQQISASGFTSGHKGDRLVIEAPPPSARQVVPVSTISRVDNRDVIQQHPFIRITAPLAGPYDPTITVPDYDPMTILGQEDTGTPDVAPVAGPAGDRLYGANVDGEVVVETGPFPLGAQFADVGPEVQTADVEQIVRDAAPQFATENGVMVGALAYAPPDTMTLGDGDAVLDATATVTPNVRSIPENVSFVTKSTAEGDVSRDERILSIADGQTLDDVLQGTGMSDGDRHDAVTAMEALIDLSQLTTTNTVRIAFAPSLGADADAAPVPLRVSIYMNGTHQATVARNDEGVFVRADEPPVLPQNLMADDQQQVATGQLPSLYNAIYSTAVEQQMPQNLINQLLRIFAFDVDMQSRVGPRDSLEVFYADPTQDDTTTASEGILYASVTLAGVTKRYYRYQTADDGKVDYYDQDGHSASIFLVRKPISVGVVTSPYGYRIHPILGTRILHAGVDYGAPAGTPIYAAGDGVVVSAGWSSSYGNYTRIQHANGYQTGYAHQTRIADGIVPGVHVHQGQVIGYVGSTGLSTGPHLHFEIWINGSTVDPLRVRLPNGRVLDGQLLTNFESERNDLDNLLGISDTPTPQVATAH